MRMASMLRRLRDALGLQGDGRDGRGRYRTRPGCAAPLFAAGNTASTHRLRDALGRFATRRALSLAAGAAADLELLREERQLSGWPASTPAQAAGARDARGRFLPSVRETAEQRAQRRADREEQRAINRDLHAMLREDDRQQRADRGRLARRRARRQRQAAAARAGQQVHATAARRPLLRVRTL